MRTHLHLCEDDQATARVEDHYIALDIAGPSGSATLMLTTNDVGRGALIAAAINGNHAAMREILDAIAPVPDEADSPNEAV